MRPKWADTANSSKCHRVNVCAVSGNVCETILVFALKIAQTNKAKRVTITFQNPIAI